jgi:hypothetical protein
VGDASLKECLGSWRGQRGICTVIQIWRMAPLCVMWCLWRERNALSFEDRELGIIELKKGCFKHFSHGEFCGILCKF